MLRSSIGSYRDNARAAKMAGGRSRAAAIRVVVPGARTYPLRVNAGTGAADARWAGRTVGDKELAWIIHDHWRAWSKPLI
jgi:hypothetical protein